MVHRGNPPGKRLCVGHTWRQLQDRLIGQAQACDQPCPLCGKPIIYQLRSVNPTHPKAPSLDHIIPKSRGGAQLDPANLRVAHYGCNSARGNRLTSRKAVRSRNW